MQIKSNTTLGLQPADEGSMIRQPGYDVVNASFDRTPNLQISSAGATICLIWIADAEIHCDAPLSPDVIIANDCYGYGSDFYCVTRYIRRYADEMIKLNALTDAINGIIIELNNAAPFLNGLMAVAKARPRDH